MADDLARLIASFEVRTAAAERSLAKIQAQTSQAMSKIAADVTRGSKDLSRAFETVNVSSLTAQIQDIGVQLASGTSPFLIMAQQGPQITAAFGPGVGVTGVIKGLGSAIGSLVNPVSLATFAIVGLATTAISYFFSADTTIEKTNDLLIKHGELIAALKERYGAAAEGLTKLAAESQAVLNALARLNEQSLRFALQSEAEGLSEKLRLLSDTVGETDARWQPLLQVIDDFNQSVARGAPDVAALRDGLSSLALAEGDKALADAAKEGLELSNAAGDLARALPAAADAIALTGDEAARAADLMRVYQASMAQARAEALALAAAANTAFAAARRAANAGDVAGQAAQGQQFAAELGRENARGQALTGLSQRTAAEQFLAGNRPGFADPLPRVRGGGGGGGRRRAGGRRAGGGGGGGGQDDVAREIEQLERRLRIIEAEAGAIEKGNAARETAKTLAELKIAADSKQGLQIADLIAKTEQYKESINKVEEAQKAAQETADFFGDLAFDALDSIIIGGEDASDVIRRLGQALASAALQAALLGDGPMAGLFGGGKGGGGLIGLLGKAFGFKAEGGPVKAGSPYIVGEKGPEPFFPATNGSIMSNSEMRAALRGGGGGTRVTQTIVIDGAAGDAHIRRLVAQGVAEGNRQVIAGEQARMDARGWRLG